MAAPPAEANSGAAASTLRTKITRVALASAVAQFLGEGISLIQTVVLARLLTPADIGVFAAGTVLTAFLVNFSEGGMRAGLIHREDGLADAAETVFWGTMISGFVMGLGALAAAPLIGLVFDSHTAGLIAAVSSGGLLLYALTNVPEAMLQRSFNVRRRLVVGPAVAVSFAVVSVTLAALGFGVWSLVMGTYASSLVLLIAVWWITDWRPGRGKASWRQWRQLARYGFPLVVGFIGSRSQQLIESVVVGRGLSTTALGYYRYGTRISRIPVNAILEIVANALFPAFSRMAGDRDRFRASYLQALGSVTIFAAAVCGLIIAVGEPAVVVLLGEPWRGAGLAVVAMAGLGLGKAFTSVSEEALKGAGRTGLLNWLTGAEVFFGVGLLVLIIPFGLVGVGLAISITALIVGVLCLNLARPVVHVTIGQICRAVLPQLAAAAVAGAATAWLERSFVHADQHGLALGVLLLVLDGLAFLVVYGGVLAVIAPRAVRHLIQMRGGGTAPEKGRHRAARRP